MKKQGSFYLKIISITMAVFLVVYFLVSVLIRDGVPHTTQSAVYCEVGDGETVSGFVVRDESVLYSSAPIILYELDEGERVGSAQTVAMVYHTDAERLVRQQLLSLRQQRRQLDLASHESDGKNAESLNDQIGDLIVDIASKTHRQHVDTIHPDVGQLEPLVLRRCANGSDSEQIRERIARIDARIALLEQDDMGQANAITVAESGYFSHVVDGMEHILTPQRAMKMTAEEFLELRKTQTYLPDDAIGRLVVGQKWYFLTQIPEKRSCEIGDYLTVSFAGEGLQNLDMYVERIDDAIDGKKLILLSCKRQLQRMTAERLSTAQILFGSYEGLRISKQAVYARDGQMGVYVLQAGRAEWKPVEKLMEYEEYYLVKWDRSDADGLRPEDQIILTEREITDGTVMGE
ncbi:MAG: hypothetical protein E7467_02790 [Ruminococcaceae bacterium]|nr:hypothetical protein [Oscillospiraceae bacterium]